MSCKKEDGLKEADANELFEAIEKNVSLLHQKQKWEDFTQR